MEAKVKPNTREEVSDEAKWDLSGLYASGQMWQVEFSDLEKEAQAYANHQGRLGKSVDALKACLELDMNVSRKLERLYTFAHLRNDEDKTNTAHQGNFEKIVRLYTQVSQQSSFIKSELMEIPADKMQALLDSKDLAPYKYHIERILRFREHTLSEKEESLLAASQEMARAAREGFDMLDNADLKLGKVEDDKGEEIEITHGNFQSLMQNYDRRVRKETFKTFYSAYQEHQYTYASLLASSIKKDMFYARAKRFPSVRGQALFSENIPENVYDSLVQSVHENLNPLHRYFAIRKRLLKLDALHVYDLSVPLVTGFHWRMTYNEAVDKIMDALHPLGEEYVRILKKGAD